MSGELYSGDNSGVISGDNSGDISGDISGDNSGNAYSHDYSYSNNYYNYEYYGSGSSTADYTSQLNTISSEAYWNSYGALIALQNSLYQNLTQTANLYKALRPTMPTEVMPFFTIIKTLGLTNSGILSITGILLLNWVDPRLSWSYQNYSITQFNMIVANMWYPPLTLLNSASPGSITPGSAAVAQVLYTGLVSVNIPSFFTSSCTLDLSDFPYDTQTCSLIFVSLDSNGTSPGISFFIPNTTELSLDYYYETGEFTLNRGTLTTGKRFCSISCYSTMVITLVLSRQSSYYETTVIIPAILLTFLLALALVVPSDNSIKINVACTLMVSLYTLQQSLARALPATNKAPYLSIGMLCSLSLAACCVTFTIICVILRMLQPQIGLACGQVLDRLSCLICLKKKNKVNVQVLKVEPLKFVGDSSIPAQFDDTAATENKNAGQHAMLKLFELQTSTAIRSSREAAEKTARDGENSRRWRTVDTIVNLTLLCSYIIAAVTCLFLFNIPGV